MNILAKEERRSSLLNDFLACAGINFDKKTWFWVSIYYNWK